MFFIESNNSSTERSGRMRKVKYFVANSLDNFTARPDGAVDWLFMDGTDYGISEFFKTIDTVLLGRKTYEPALGKGRSSKGKSSKRKNPFMGMSSYVFSRTMKNAGDEGVKIISENGSAPLVCWCWSCPNGISICYLCLRSCYLQLIVTLNSIFKRSIGEISTMFGWPTALIADQHRLLIPNTYISH